jgi:riboflavin synthase
MFTGLVKTVGRVYRVKPIAGKRRLIIDTVNWHHAANQGDSVCVSGCCLTVAQDPGSDNGLLCFDVIEETLTKTSIGRLEAGDRVNLETALRPSDAIGGHFVQGHVDGTGDVLQALKGGPDGSGEWRLRIQPPAALSRFLTPQGSVCIEGVSLTLAALDPQAGWFEVALIPETLAKTTLADLEVGDTVNLEMDVLAKTIVHYLEHHLPGMQHAAAARA